MYGCCSFPGMSGIDCTKYAFNRGIYLYLDFDSTNSGFTLVEVDSTYIVKFSNDSLAPLSAVIDTQFFNRDNFSERRSLEFSDIDNSKTTDYEVQYNYIIKNKYTNNELRITNIKMVIDINDNKCCSNYTGQHAKSYFVNGVYKEEQLEVILKK